MISELDSLAEDVDARGVEEGGIYVWCGAVEEMAAADGEDLAHGIASVENATLIGLGCPHQVILLDLDDDNIVGNALQQCCKILIQQTLLPDAPQHPLQPERGKVVADVCSIIGFGASLGPCTRRHHADVLLRLDSLVIVTAPLAT